MNLVTLADIEAAAQRINGVAHRTPVLTSRTLDDRLSCQIFFKAENFQRAGAFKFRGAYNALLQLSDDQKHKGVVTYSSGNHAQALALAGQLLGIPVTVIMPNDAPAIKRAATEAYGGEVVLYDREESVREKLGTELSQQRGLTLVPPFDHPHIIAGAGTAALELLQDHELDLILVPAGGGGLASGTAVAAKGMNPAIRVVAVEPEAGDDIARSVRSGRLESVTNPQTIADGARTNSASELTFHHIQNLVDDVVTVPDRTLVEVSRFMAERMKVIVEPTGALGLAAAWNGTVDVRGQRVGVIVSGGNADLSGLCGFWATL